MELTQERLKELLDYDPETGVFTWRKRKGGARAGKKAGCVCHYGYIVIRIDDRLYRAARLAWFYTFGHWPHGVVDHIDSNRKNDRLENLRVTSQRNNTRNTRMHKDNKCGYKGVFQGRAKGRYYAQICVNGKRRHLGTFDCPREAHAAYVEAARKHYGEYARAS
jgi:hypothetical protein